MYKTETASASNGSQRKLKQKQLKFKNLPLELRLNLPQTFLDNKQLHVTASFFFSFIAQRTPQTNIVLEALLFFSQTQCWVLEYFQVKMDTITTQK